MLGPIRVNLWSRRTSLWDFFAIRVVFSAVLMVLTWCSVKLLDLGKWGEDVECSMWVDAGEIVGAPQMKRASHCPLRAGVVANTDISSSRCTHRDWADLVVALYRKGYLLNTSQMSRYSLPWWVR